GTVNINDPHQLVGVVGYDPSLEMVVFHDDVNNSKNYNYSVVAVSGTNTKGQARTVNTSSATELPFDIGTINDLKVSNENIYFNDEIQFEWSSANIKYGSTMDYELQYSYDQENWYTDTTGRLRFTGSVYRYTI